MSSTLQPGGRLGVYEILSSLGEGGMGAVYRARDTRLKRDVAIKVLLPEVASDPERLARFQREAEVLATLNHPNIAHIYGLESQEGREGQESRDGLVGPFLVLELVEGPTLADRIAGMNGRGLPLDEALPIAKQIAEALEAAHEHGIIHRDLKPANIKVRDDGTVKVLDFGLAKAIETTGAGRAGRAGGAGQAGAPHADNTASPLARHALTNSPTLTSPALMTGVGMLLGTAAYMSPEQAKGKPADKRADIWAFGCVLYEMLTGRRAFDGDDATEVIASVVKSIPDWSALPDGIPSTLVKLLQRCLEKDRQARIADLSVVRYVLAEVASGDVVAGGRLASRGAGAAVDAGRPRWFVALAVASLLFVALASALATRSLSRPAQTTTRIEHLIVPTASDAKAPTWAGSNQIRLTISPDGERLVYHGRSVDTNSTGRRPPLLMKIREQNEAIAIAGTEGGDGPFFSPDSRWLAFTDPVERALKRVPASGGTPQTICLLEGEFRGGAWTVDDHIVFGTTGGAGLWRVSATGGQPEHITKVDAARGELDHLWPESIPGADAVIFTAWAGSAERSRIVALSLKDGRLSTLINGGSFGRYVPTGHLLFARGGRLHAVRFDAPTLSASSDAQVVVENVAMSTYGAAQFAVASDGTLVFGSGAPGNDPKTLVWVDRQGKEEPINLPAHAYVYARLSPDGTRIALDARDEQSDIWVFDLQRETLQRLTTDPSADRGPVWTPDGKRIAFLSSRDGKLEGAYWQNADGSGPATRIDAGVRPTVPAGFVSDTSRVVFMTPTGAPYDIGMFDIADPRREVMLLQSPFNENNPEVSPDGKWVAYSSNESGQNEVYVSPFPEMASAKTLVSNGGGSRPVWSRDGQELFYYGEPGTIMAVAVRPGASFSLGKAVVAVKGSYSTPALSGRHYDVSLDGKRFLLFKDVEASGAGRSGEPQIHIILNFFDELKRVAGNGH